MEDEEERVNLVRDGQEAELVNRTPRRRNLLASAAMEEREFTKACMAVTATITSTPKVSRQLPFSGGEKNKNQKLRRQTIPRQQRTRITELETKRLPEVPEQGVG